MRSDDPELSRANPDTEGGGFAQPPDVTGRDFAHLAIADRKAAKAAKQLRSVPTRPTVSPAARKRPRRGMGAPQIPDRTRRYGPAVRSSSC